ncbi:calcium-binding protein P-like [Corticium candelabrum]|uniref:calcium-binding protein P-like n=1 Tax=Corticium candelabrum TaxID=121492 RepID=UPI002E256664|nr:calcium-binding protein P-like [Corticium candelabrum]
MDSFTFSQLEQRLQQTGFADGKLAVINFVGGNFSGSQLAQLLRHFPHSSNQLKVLQSIQHRIVGLTSMEIKFIINNMPFSNDKVQALEILSRHVIDPANQFVILESFSFPSDRQRAQQVLTQNQHMVAGADASGLSMGGYSPAPPAYLQPTQNSYPSSSTGYPPQVAAAYPSGYLPQTSEPYSSAYPPPTYMYPSHTTQAGAYAAAQQGGAYPPTAQDGAYPMSAPGAHYHGGSAAYPPQQQGAYHPSGQSGAYPPRGGEGYPPGGAFPPSQSGYLGGHTVGTGLGSQMMGTPFGGVATGHGMPTAGAYPPAGPPGYPPPY